jgi:short-subunit dehydrogenase
MAGQRAVPGVAVYSASKFGVLALSQAIAKENADIPLKCVTVCPGGMNTEMREAIFGKADAEKQQSPDYVADVIFDVYHDKVQVESGGDIVIRHGQISAIHPCPQV